MFKRLTPTEYVEALTNIINECKRNGRPVATIYYLRDIVAGDSELNPRLKTAIIDEIDLTVEKLRKRFKTA